MASTVTNVASLPGAVPQRDARHGGPVVLAATTAHVDQLVKHLGDAQLPHARGSLSFVLRHLTKQPVDRLVHLQTATTRLMWCEVQWLHLSQQPELLGNGAALKYYMYSKLLTMGSEI